MKLGFGKTNEEIIVRGCNPPICRIAESHKDPTSRRNITCGLTDYTKFIQTLFIGWQVYVRGLLVKWYPMSLLKGLRLHALERVWSRGNPCVSLDPTLQRAHGREWAEESWATFTLCFNVAVAEVIEPEIYWMKAEFWITHILTGECQWSSKNWQDTYHQSDTSTAQKPLLISCRRSILHAIQLYQDQASIYMSTCRPFKYLFNMSAGDLRNAPFNQKLFNHESQIFPEH